MVMAPLADTLYLNVYSASCAGDRSDAASEVPGPGWRGVQDAVAALIDPACAKSPDHSVMRTAVAAQAIKPPDFIYRRHADASEAAKRRA